jgi:hypothetical protein
METIVTVRMQGLGARVYLNSDICKMFQLKEDDQLKIEVIKVIKNPIERGKSEDEK